MRSVSIIGCGYVGLRLAARWLAAGRTVIGTATRAESLAETAACGATARLLDLDAPRPAPDVGGHLVYYLVPPAQSGADDARLERWLAALDADPWRIVYMSTTGVYGDHGGSRVDEDSPVQPATPRARRRLAAEQALRAWATARAVSWCILRVPGIYGPGRLPLERLRRAEPAICPREAAPGNRIQVEDLVSACVAAGADGRAHQRIFNISDGTEDSATAFLERVARLAGLPAPPLVSRAAAAQALSPAAWSFLAESRRIDNRRMLEELGITLRFPDLDAGIRASL